MFKKNIHETPLDPDLFHMARLTVKVRKLHKKTSRRRKKLTKSHQSIEKTPNDDKTISTKTRKRRKNNKSKDKSKESKNRGVVRFRY